MNVKFFSVKLKSTFDAIETKDSLALYWIAETSELYKGDQLFGVGALATKVADGLLSAEDKAKLDALVLGDGISNLSAVDGTLVIADGAEGGKTISVAISDEAGNVLVKKEDGLYVDSVGSADLPSYSIEKQETAEDGYATSYKLKKTVGQEESYVGDVINIPKDLVLKAATLEVVSNPDAPYIGAVVGDPYIDMAFNDANASHIYVPVKDLVDTYTAGNGIDIVDGVVSVKIATESNGLQFVDGAMSMALATTTSAGALSAVDKAIIDSIANTYATKADVQVISDKISAAEESYTWTDM